MLIIIKISKSHAELVSASVNIFKKIDPETSSG